MFSVIEARNWGACFEAARKAGYTQEQAENCEDGALQCPTCPWKPREVPR